MGRVIDFRQVSDEEALTSRLIVYCEAIEKSVEVQSISKDLAEGLLACKQKRRSLRLEQILNNVLDNYPDDVVIKDIDVMLNPEYKVDVLKILISARKRKKYRVIWPGRFENGKLVYGEEGYPDYKVFNIADYDIMFVK